MKNTVLPTIVACCGLLSGCIENLTADDTNAYQYLARGESAQSGDKLIQVISTQSSFDEVFYRLLNRSGTPETINFSQYQVLLVMTGSQQYMLQLGVDSIYGMSNQVQIKLITEYAGANCVLPAVVRQPWMLVLFPKVAKPLLIQEQVKIKDC